MYPNTLYAISLTIMPPSFDLENEIFKEHSKKNTVRIANWVGKNDNRFALVMHHFLGRENTLVQRSGWIITHCVERYPDLALPWIRKMIKKSCEKNVHDSVQRNVMRSLQFVEIPKKDRGIAVNAAFDMLQSVRSSVAAKAFSMTVLANIAVEEPDLKQEIVLALEEILSNPGSAGIHAHARMVLKDFSRT